MVTDKRYVGSAVDIKKRWWIHKSDLRGGKHHSEKLQRSWDKHGEESFDFIILEHVEDKSQLLQKEQTWMDFWNCVDNGYNVLRFAGKGMLGRTHTEEAKLKMSAARLGTKQSPETLAILSKIRKGKPGPNKGKKLTPEQCAAISARLTGVPSKKKGIPLTPEQLISVRAKREARRLEKLASQRGEHIENNQTTDDK